MIAGAKLQWSHVFSDMVRTARVWVPKSWEGLQWSHVFSDMVRFSASETSSTKEGFNGAMSFQTW